MTVEIVSADFLDPRSVELRRLMVEEMSELYGRPRHTAPAEDLAPASVIASFLALDDGEPIATVSLRHLRDLVEIKRMYIRPGHRGRGLAARLLARVEDRASTITREVVLHTGERQVAAIGLYVRSGYRRIDVYPPYDEVPESVCFAKSLTPPPCS